MDGAQVSNLFHETEPWKQ